MMYENYEKATDLVKEIREYNDILEELDSCPNVIIGYPHSIREIYTIGTKNYCDDQYTELAKKLLIDIKSNVVSRLKELHSELAKL